MNSENKHLIHSPNSTLSLSIGIDDGARVWYSLSAGHKVLIAPSTLSLTNTGGADLLLVTGEPRFEQTSFDETWEQPWGEQRLVRNSYNEISLIAEVFTVRFRLFDDSLGFRYELHGKGNAHIAQEEIEFNVPSQSHAWWIPALGHNHYEHQFVKTTLPDIDTAHTPLTIELPSDGFLAIHEAALYNYGAMNIIPSESGLKSNLTPLIDGTAGEVSLPFKAPWRTVIFSETAAGLGTSKVMLNLNDPSKIADTSWIKPAKFMGIWWAMFINYYTWESGPKHGATTANAMRYINAARDLGITGLLIEGWNVGWDGDWIQNADKMNHMQPYPDFDIHTVTSYAKSQGVDIVGHHETCGNVAHYEFELPAAYDYYRHFGVRYIKTGYVAPRMTSGDFHSSQTGVLHYQKTVEMAAERRIMLDIHEPVKGTGIERTWPNLMTREGVMGQEYEGGAIDPQHTTVLPFTRLLSGPLDYTPGLFNLSGTSRKVHSTLAKQLAFYVTMYSPLQMVADLPEHYQHHLDAFQFIKDVPTNWETTIPLDGVIGDFYTVARKERIGDDWFVGGVSDENERTVDINLSFLDPHQTYKAVIYRDGDDAHWDTKPESYTIDTQTVGNTDSVTVRMAAGGGFAMHISPTHRVAGPQYS